MTTQNDIQALLRDIQTQMQAQGLAKVKAKKPELLHRSLYKVIKRRGWKFMRLAHDEHHVFIRRSVI